MLFLALDSEYPSHMVSLAFDCGETPYLSRGPGVLQTFDMTLDDLTLRTVQRPSLLKVVISDLSQRGESLQA